MPNYAVLMHSHLYYHYPYRAFVWMLPVLAQISRNREVVATAWEICMLMLGVTMFAHWITMILEFHMQIGHTGAALAHWGCFHLFATALFPVIIHMIYAQYDHANPEVPFAERTGSLLFVLALTIFQDKMVKFLCDMAFGAPPDFDRGESKFFRWVESFNERSKLIG